MKNIIKYIILSICISIGANAQTNVVEVEQETKEYGSWEVTLGGGGSSVKGNSDFGLDFSIATNPFEKLSSLWVGVAQSIYWEPCVSGSTDVFVDWNTHVYKDLYLNTGWSVGTVYDRYASSIFRTGPEVSLQYYTSDNAFIYAGINYDFVNRGNNGLRYSFGLGLSF
jgi:hypothetical protein